MFEKLKRMLSSTRESKSPSPRTNFAQSIKSYPPYLAPYVGFARQLSEASALENLAYFKDVQTKRLEYLAALLRDDAGIDIGPALSAPREHSLGLTDSLSKWAGDRWIQFHDPRFATTDGWLKSRREGNDIVLSLMVDVAILLGELVIRVNPDWRWGIDFDKGNLKDEMLSSHRIVLIADPVGAMPFPFVEDVEAVVVSRFQQIDRDNERLLAMNPFRRMVDEGQRGAAMDYYR